MKKISLILLSTAALSACTPKDIDFNEGTTALTSGEMRLEANRIEPKAHSAFVYFDGNATAVTTQDVAAFAPFRDQEVDGIWIYGPKKDNARAAREQSITRMFRGMGIPSTRIFTETSPDLATGNYRVDVAYTTTIAPACPNWSSSASRSVLNRNYSQMGCANVTNIGQQVRNPRDLERGHGNVRPSAMGVARAIESYNNNAAAAASSPVSGGSQSGSSASNGASGSSSNSAGASSGQ